MKLHDVKHSSHHCTCDIWWWLYTKHIGDTWITQYWVHFCISYNCWIFTILNSCTVWNTLLSATETIFMSENTLQSAPSLQIRAWSHFPVLTCIGLFSVLSFLWTIPICIEQVLDCLSISLCDLPHCYSNHFDSGGKVQSSRHWYSPVRLYGITTQAVMTGV